MIASIVTSGVRGIFCEKPLASSLQEARKIISLCDKKNVVLSVNHTRRWGHDYRTLKKLITQGKIGDVQHVSGVFSGALFHTGTHMFDILNYLFGSPKGVCTTRLAEYTTIPHTTEVHDETFHDFDGSATILYDNDIQVHIDGVAKEYFIFEIDIFGTKGRIRIGNNILQMYSVRKSKYYAGFKEIEKKKFPQEAYRYEPLVWAVKDLIDSMERHTPNISSAQDAEVALAIAIGICQSYEKNMKYVSFPIQSRMKVYAK